MTIVIVGLGPGNPAHLTREAWEVISQADEIHVRTTRHPTVAALPLGLAVHSFDYLYETVDNFAGLYEMIAEQVVDLGRRPEGVLYAVPGHPRVGESSVQHILELARQQSRPVRIVEGLSFVEPVLSLLGIDGLDGLQLADAIDVAAAHYPHLDPDRPALIGQLYSQRLASEVKLALMNAYPDEHQVTLVRAAGTGEGAATVVPLYELDRGQAVDHLTTLYVPPLPWVASLASFQNTVARLRAPDGCPWDQEQTHRSLRSGLLEETYEVLAALDEQDAGKLCEELGDLLMQIAMHVQIATEEGEFRNADVIGRIDAKLKRRHPHVFADLHVQGAAEVLRNWEAIKQKERAESGEEGDVASPLNSVPLMLPALARAQALGERAARVGFDWPDLSGVLEKIVEETDELRSASDARDQARELGDLLFSVVNLARWLDVEAESALRETCGRFTRRYHAMDRLARAQGRNLTELSLAEQDALWDQVKAGSDDPPAAGGPPVAGGPGQHREV